MINFLSSNLTYCLTSSVMFIGLGIFIGYNFSRFLIRKRTKTLLVLFSLYFIRSADLMKLTRFLAFISGQGMFGYSLIISGGSLMNILYNLKKNNHIEENFKDGYTNYELTKSTQENIFEKLRQEGLIK